jgi:hypothetical protein
MRPALALASLLCAACAAERPWTSLFDGTRLDGWEVTEFGGEGEVALVDGRVRLGFGSPLTGVHWTGPLPEGEYELEVVALRRAGTDFFCGLTFPVAGAHLTLVLGGWGGATSGLSCVDGADASANGTTSYHWFEPGRAYALRLEVRADAVRAWLDGAPLLEQPLAGRALTLRPEVLPSRPLGIASFVTEAELLSVRWRALE